MRIEGTSSDGSLNIAKVNKEGRLNVRAISATEVEHSVEEGDAFQVYTGVINIANDSRTALLYIKNDDTSDIFLTSATIGTRPSTGGTDSVILVESVGGVLPTDAIVVSGTDTPAINRNGGAPRQFAGVVKKGPTASAVSAVSVSGVLSDFTLERQLEVTNIIPKGGSLALEVVPPTGNTSLDITLSVGFHILEEV